MNLLPIIAIIISFGALLVNYLSYRYNKTIDNKQYQKEMDQKYHQLSTEIEVIKVKINHEVDLLEKLENKIDDLYERMMN